VRRWGVSAFDELRSRILDDSDRVLFDEAVMCHETGAYRAAYVFAWIAAAEGLLGKLRTMGALHADISQFVDKFEAKQRTGDAKDVELIDKAASIDFIDVTEAKALNSIRDLRNQYGHPTATAPSAAAATFAIETAVDAVLAKDALLLHGAAKELANRLGSDPHFLPDSDDAVAAWTEPRAALIHMKARPLFIRTLVEHHAAGLVDVNELISNRCRQVAVTALTAWGERLDAPPWDVDRLQQRHPASAADVFTDHEVWPLLGPEDQYRLLSRCLDTSSAPTQPNLTRRLLSRAFELDASGFLLSDQAGLVEDSIGRIDVTWLTTANVPVRRIVPRIISLLKDGSFAVNKEGTKLLEAVDRTQLWEVDVQLLSEVGTALAGATRRGAYVARNLMGAMASSSSEWPLDLRIAAAVDGATQPWLFYDEVAARLAMRLALADPAVAAAVRAAMPDVNDPNVSAGYNALEVVESMAEAAEETPGAAQGDVTEVLEVVRSVFRRNYPDNAD
jgi:hypothetical protein